MCDRFASANRETVQSFIIELMSAHPDFAMPKPVRITGRTSSITNSFINGVIPVIRPSREEVEEALQVLRMERVVCAYCGDSATEWDHFRPLVMDKRPTGYITEIRNLVPACGKCNQSKGNRQWREWIYSSARLSPFSRGVVDLDARVAHLEDFEAWGDPTVVDFEALVGGLLWGRHWENHAAIVELMREAEETARKIRARIALSREAVAPTEPGAKDDC